MMLFPAVKRTLGWRGILAFSVLKTCLPLYRLRGNNKEVIAAALMRLAVENTKSRTLCKKTLQCEALRDEFRTRLEHDIEAFDRIHSYLFAELAKL